MSEEIQKIIEKAVKRENGNGINSAVAEKYQEHSERHHRIIKSFEARALSKRTARDKFVDYLVESSGTLPIFLFHALWFFIWIIINVGWIPEIAPFDPFPFNLLTMAVSLEAIALTIFVLMSQGRQKKIDDLRSEIALQVSLIAEEEVTKIMHLLAELHQHLGLNREYDPELEQMLKPINTHEIEKKLEYQIFGKEKLPL